MRSCILWRVYKQSRNGVSRTRRKRYILFTKYKLNKNTFYATQIHNFAIKNVSCSNIIIKGIMIDNLTYCFKNNMLLEPNLTCKVITTGNCEVLFANNINYFGIIIDDILGNSYIVECLFENKIDTDVGPLMVTEEDGVKFRGFKHNYLIKSAGLPMFNKEQ